MKLLVISNGHGEDVIALKIIGQLKELLPSLKIAALPMVGEGFAYTRSSIEIVTDVKSMPSGGFVYMDNQQLWGDIRNGLLALSIRQYQCLKEWGKNGGVILAVGDILPLLLAWISGLDYFFVGTAKSEYYLRDEDDWLPHVSKLERYWGSYYYPWEYWLMKNSRCLGVFPRDSMTTSTLQKAGIKAHDLGNPMMDDLSVLSSVSTDEYVLKVLLLAGSRMPEAINNWQLILEGVDSIIDSYDNDFMCLGAIAPSLSLSEFKQCLLNSGWESPTQKFYFDIVDDPQIMYFKKQQGTLILTQNAYSESLNYCNISLAMAGTATEQFVGLGKVAIAFPGKGPQYNSKFAENQKHLLGISLQLIDKPQQVGKKIKELLSNPEKLAKIAVNGKKRLGKIGASQRIAKLIEETINKNS